MNYIIKIIKTDYDKVEEEIYEEEYEYDDDDFKDDDEAVNHILELALGERP